jgi:phosphoribosylformimino-5-aminoimidazole carboxamide ribotide isomerase
MILYPAIDLKDGQAVRLYKGDFNQMTVFDADPATRAKSFQSMGFTYLHVVDLDGALRGAGTNGEAVKAIRAATDIPIQLGGGIRDLASIEATLDMGVTRVILGTIGIDAIDGMVAVEGWVETTDLSALDLAKQFEGVGVAALIVTDVGRDGTKTGINIGFTAAIANAVSIPVIASGGLAGIGDISSLKAERGTPIAGAILGRALYDGLIDPVQALSTAL